MRRPAERDEQMAEWSGSMQEERMGRGGSDEDRSRFSGVDGPGPGTGEG